MRAPRFLGTILLIFFALESFSGVANAAEQTYVREYTYQASRLDTEISARAIALQEVKRALLNEIGTHVRSLVKINTSSDGTQLATEEIETLSAGVTKVIILDEKWNGLKYFLKAQIKADPEEVLASLDKMLDADQKKKDIIQLNKEVTRLRLQNINISDSLIKAKNETIKAMAEIIHIKQQYETRQTESSRQILQASYNQNVSRLTLIDWFESGIFYYRNGEKKTAFMLFKKAAELGYATAQSSLGMMYFNGDGIAKDLELAVYWLQSAVDSGDVYAKLSLGLMYQAGIGVKKDESKSLQLIRSAAEAGLHVADDYYKLFALNNGESVTSDLDKASDKFAVSIYTMLAQDGDTNSQSRLAFMYYLGKRVGRDYDKAVYWATKAAMQDDTGAQYLLGTFYSEIKHDDVAAQIWLKEPALKGMMVAQNSLGKLFLRSEKYDEAFVWIKLAAEQGSVDSQYALGLLYFSGTGITKNITEAKYWLSKAAERGHVQAQNHLRKANAEFDFDTDPVFKDLQ